MGASSGTSSTGSSKSSSRSSEVSQKYLANFATFEKRLSAIDMDSIEEEMPQRYSKRISGPPPVHMHQSSRSLDSCFGNNVSVNDMPDHTTLKQNKSDSLIPRHSKGYNMNPRRSTSFLPDPIDAGLDEYNPPKRNKKALTLLGVGVHVSRSNPMQKLKVPKQPQLETIVSHSESMKNTDFEFVEDGYEKYLEADDDDDQEPVPTETPSQRVMDFQLNLSDIDSRHHNAGSAVVDEEHEMKTGAYSTAFEFDLPTKHAKHSDNLSVPDIKSDSAQTITPVHVDDMLDVLTKFGFLQRENINSVKQLNQYEQRAAMMRKAALAKSNP